MNQSPITIISLLLSIVGAYLGMFSYYITQVESPNIIAHVSERVRLGGTKGGGFQFYVPVTFINKSHQTGVVLKVNMSIYADNKPNKIYSIDLARFSELNADKRLIDKELPHAIAVNGKSSVYKLLHFVWWNSSIPTLVIEDTGYIITLNIWTSDQVKSDIATKHSLTFSASQINKLEKLRENNGLIDVPLDKNPPNNRLINVNGINIP